MNKKQIVAISLVFVLGLAVVPSSVYMMGTTINSKSFFVDILGSNGLADDIENLDVKNMPEASSWASSNLISEKFPVQKPKILEEETTTYIRDPTGKTTGYTLEDYPEDFFELKGSRGQTSRHFYNKTTRKYTYQSANFVQKEGVFEETNWVTAEEYPHRFLLRQRDGEIIFFESASEISTYLTQIDRTSIWAVGFESYSGVMGFYLNFQDSVNGHAQYLYWPRLDTGEISAYNMPLYAIYPHLYASTDGIWLDQILNDRSLYSGPAQNPRNTLEFHNTENEFKVSYSLSGVNIQGTIWNLKHGFKYRLEDESYHMITEFECVNHDFEDIGMAYEITTSPQSDNTPFKPVGFILNNDSEEIVVSAQESWQANQLIEDFYSKVSIIAENNLSFSFSFKDMELVGFTEKYLKLHDQQMPDGTTQKVLCAGMYGLGKYTAGTWVEIDPNTVSKETIDDYDLYHYYQGNPGSPWVTSLNYMYIGYFWSPMTGQYKQEAFVGFDTDISYELGPITEASIELYCTSDTTDSGEGITATVYNIKGNRNIDTAREASQSYDLNDYSTETGVIINPTTSQYNSFDGTKAKNLVQAWANTRDNDDEQISFRLRGYGCDTGENDRVVFQDADYGSNEANLTFSYAWPNQQFEISGYVKANTAGNPPIEGVTVESFYNNIRHNGSTTDSSGYYSFKVNESEYQHTVWAWHEDYVKQSDGVTPDQDRTVNFYMSAESVPSINPPSGCKDPTNHFDPDSAWTSESEAYTKGTNYAVGNTGWKYINYTGFNWNVPSGVTIQGVYVYIHWKPALDDYLQIRLYWDDGVSQVKFRTTSNWDLDVINFTDATSWTASKINSNNFKVEIRQMIDTTTDSPDKVLIDWVGTYVQYPELNVTSVSVINSPEKGDDVQFNITIENIGNGNATDVETRIKIIGNSYDWSGYICNYLDWDTTLYADTIESHTITIPKFFNHGGKYHAWNAGDYYIDQVDAQYDDGAITSYTTNVSFTINTASTHIVFVTAIVFDDLNTSAPENCLNGIEDQQIYVNRSTGWETTTLSGTPFSINFDLQVFESDNDTSGVTKDNWSTWLKEIGGDILGISTGNSKWSEGSGGTRAQNHGFDILIGIADVTAEALNAEARTSVNHIIIRGAKENNLYTYYHEILHCFLNSGRTLDHLEYPPMWIYNETTEEYQWNNSYQIWDWSGGYIMNVYSPNAKTSWHLHPDNEGRLTNHIDYFDGFPDN